jgi:hypothetical protein
VANCFPPGYLGYPAQAPGDCSTVYTSIIPDMGSPGIAPSRGTGWGWGTYLLPYIDQGNLYNLLDPSSKQCVCDNAVAPANSPNVGSAALERRILSVFVCPTATDPDVHSTRDTSTTPNSPSAHAKSNYRGVCGVNFNGQESNPANTATFGLSGVFGNAAMFPPTKIASVADGTSNTLAIGECYRRDLDSNLQVFSVIGGKPEYVGARWFGIAADDRQTAAVGQLNMAPGTFSINGASINAFASQHAGGAHFLLTDGSVRFISQHADQNTISSMGTRNDGVVTGLQ